jgi:hypothetical protein
MMLPQHAGITTHCIKLKLLVASQSVLAQGKLSPYSLALFEKCGHNSVEAQIKASSNCMHLCLVLTAPFLGSFNLIQR